MCIKRNAIHLAQMLRNIPTTSNILNSGTVQPKSAMFTFYFPPITSEADTHTISRTPTQGVSLTHTHPYTYTHSCITVATQI